MTHFVVPDFETRSLCDLKKAGAWRYAEDFSTEIMVLCWTDEHGNKGRWHPNDDMEITRTLFLWITDPTCLVVAHNCQFEKAIWRRIMVPVFGFMDIPDDRWRDSLAACAMKAIPLGLEDAARVLGTPVQKDMEGSKLTLAMSRPDRKTRMLPDFRPHLPRIGDYCATDCEAQLEAHKTLGWMPPGERKVWQLDQVINERGIRLDMDYVGACQEIVKQASVPLLKEFADLTGGLRPSQRDKVIGWVSKRGLALPDMKKETIAALIGDDEADEEIDDEVWEGAFDLPEDVFRALEIRQLIGSTSIKKLDRMQHCVGLDGRARGLLQYHGATTGRWAGRLFSPHNFPRGTIKVGKKAPPAALVKEAIMTRDASYVETLLGPAVEVVVGGLRHAIVADPDYDLVVGDFAGIEARVVLALAGQYDKCALMASGADVYLSMACAIYKAPEGTFTKDNLKERTIGKCAVLGLGFQMGWRKFKLRYAPEMTDEFCTEVVTAYRTKWAPEVPKLWTAIEEAALETVLTGQPHSAYGCTYRMEGRWLTCELPSERKLWYFNPKAHRKEMPWSTPERPDVRMAWRYQAKKMGHWRWVDTFGGHLVENIVQALARDLLVDAMFRCEAENMPLVLTVHDENVCEVQKVLAKAETLRHLMEEREPWARALQIPVAAECWAGPEYRK